MLTTATLYHMIVGFGQGPPVGGEKLAPTSRIWTSGHTSRTEESTWDSRELDDIALMRRLRTPPPSMALA